MITKGTRIKQYEIVGRLGAGGMGEVYLAEDRSLGRKVAMKFLSPNLATDAQAGKRLIREARAAANLDHPNVCAIYEVGENGNLRFIVFQYIEGQTLAATLKRQPMEQANALRVASQIAEALVEAHGKGILHRDIKPENIMLTERGQVKVLDFGLAKRMSSEFAGGSREETASQLSDPGIVLGTLPYMSPEQVRGEELDVRSDIFSFGALLYHLFCGKGPFLATSKAEIISKILTHNPLPLPVASGSPALDYLVGKCLEKDREQRYQTMKDVHADLERIRLGQDLPGLTRPGDRKIADHNARAGANMLSGRAWIALLLVAMAVAGVILWLSFSRSRVEPGANRQPAVSPAYDDYVLGKVKVSSENREDNERGIQLLENAVAADRRFAPAFAELARAYLLKAFYYAPAEQKVLLEKAEVNIQKALDLDPNLADAHFARGLLLWTRARGFPHEMSIKSFKRAIALNPNLDEAHHQLAVVYIHIGLLDESWKEVDLALAINPANTLARFRYGIIALYLGKYEEAFDRLKSIPEEAHRPLRERAMANALFQLGKIDECAALVESYLKNYPADEGGAMTSVKAMLLARAGKKEETEQAIRKAIEIGKNFGHFHHTAYNIACAYALLGEPAQAIHWLQAAADDGFPNFPLFEMDPVLNSLRKDARFIVFLAKQKSQWERYKATL